MMSDKQQPSARVEAVPSRPTNMFSSDASDSDEPQVEARPRDAEKNDDTPDDNPDKKIEPLETGWLAWSQVLAGALGNCMSWGNAATFGVYQLHYQESLGLPSSQVSWIGSVAVWLTFFLCAFSGRLADAGFARHTVCAGSALTLAGIFLTSACTQWWQLFLAQGILTGAGLGLLFMPCVSVISSYFFERRPFALALAATGSGFGSVAFPLMFVRLVPRVGFAWAVRCHGLLAALLCGALCLLLRPRLRGRRAGPLFAWDAFREPTYLLFSAGTFLFFFVLYFGYFYINVYARTAVGFSTAASVDLLLIANAVGVPARIAVGWFSQRVLGPMNTYFLSMLVLAAMQFAWIGVETRAGMYVFAIGFGVAAAASQCVFIGALANLTEDPAEMGARSGIVYLMSAFAVMAGPPTAGAIIDHSGGSYLGAQIWAGVLIALSAVLVALARYFKTGPVLKVKV